MAPHLANQKCENFKSDSNGLAMVDYLINSPKYDIKRYRLAYETFKSDYYISLVCATYLAVFIVGYGREHKQLSSD